VRGTGSFNSWEKKEKRDHCRSKEVESVGGHQKKCFLGCRKKERIVFKGKGCPKPTKNHCANRRSTGGEPFETEPIASRERVCAPIGFCQGEPSPREGGEGLKYLLS